MDSFFTPTVFTIIVGGFFAIGAIVNFMAPSAIRSDYRRWGYPPWFHLVTGTLETLVVALLISPSSRPYGAVLGAVVMLAAIGTTVFNREYKRAIAPSVALLLTASLWWLSAKGF